MDTLIDHRTDRIQFIRTLYALSYSQFSGTLLYIMLSTFSCKWEGKNTWLLVVNSSEQNLSDIIRLAFEAYEGGIRKASFYVQLLLPCIGTCLMGDDCIFYYVRHLFFGPD